MNAALKKNLVELGRVLEHYSHLVVVEGYTDSEFQPTPAFKTREALSSARAAAAAEIMVGASNLGPDVIQIAGLGDSRVRESNDTATGRTANRRVEVRILSLSKARAQQLESTHLLRTAEEQRLAAERALTTHSRLARDIRAAMPDLVLPLTHADEQLLDDDDEQRRLLSEAERGFLMACRSMFVCVCLGLWLFVFVCVCV